MLPAAANPEATSPRVLVIDDDRDAADSLCLMLRVWGYQVRAAYGGEEGLAAAASSRPDCVLLDIGMPEPDGFEVARRMRLDPALRGSRIVALTGYCGQEYRDRAAGAGFDRYLVKGGDPLDILAALPAPGG